MKHPAIIVLLVLIAPQVTAQLKFDVTAESESANGGAGDTIRVCQEDTITFQARADTVYFDADADTLAFNGDGLSQNVDTIPPDSLYYEWDFDKEEQYPEFEQGNDSVDVNYVQGGGHYVHLRISMQDWLPVNSVDSIGKAMIYVQVGLSPDFSETRKEPDHPICKEDTITLIGNSDSSSWDYEPPEKVSEIEDGTDPEPITNNLPYSSHIRYISFEPYARFQTQTLDSLEKICITMEHSNTQDIKIELICPENHDTVMLKDYSAEEAFMGEPIDDENIAVAGSTSTYCWSPEPDYKTMNEKINDSQSHTGTYILPWDSTYTPAESFDNLIGCPLNGDWKINITDTSSTDNGYVESWKIVFKDSLFAPRWEFTNTYDESIGLWAGKNMITGTTNGIARAAPSPDSTFIYTYKVESEAMGCPYMYDLEAEVTKPTFDANPTQGKADPELEVNFESTTEWAEQWKWQFGDGTESSDENPTHFYKQEDVYTEDAFTERDSFPVQLRAFSESGCSDTSDITNIIVEIPASKLDMPDVFTPDNDGVNEVFKPKEVKALERVNGKVYNRWGRVVCEWNSMEELEEGWDGTIGNNGNRVASPGLYFYVIVAKGKDGENFKKKGTVHLFRE